MLTIPVNLIKRQRQEPMRLEKWSYLSRYLHISLSLSLSLSRDPRYQAQFPRYPGIPGIPGIHAQFPRLIYLFSQMVLHDKTVTLYFYC